MHRPTRRQALAGAGAASAMAALPAGIPRLTAKERPVLNDASGLNPTPVHRHLHIPADAEATLLAQLRAALKDAAAARRPVCLGAARHSMGGQALARNGTAITMDINRVELDSANRRYHVQAGTRWHQVISRLDPAGFSPAVMQSNADFGVGATFSVNAHGWPTPFGPFGSTVRQLRLLLADGSLVTASRTENAELFALAMGGYGLFGIILDLEVDMVPNIMLEPRHEVVAAEGFPARFMAAAADPAVRMLYGRFSVAKGQFLEEGLLVAYRPAPTPPEGLPPAARHVPLAGLARRIFRAQVESEWGKSFRWFMETSAAPHLLDGRATRNTLVNEPVARLRNRNPGRTDILHEYFLPPERLGAFLAGCREIIPQGRADFLNVTLRHVRQDQTSVLGYASTDRIAAVMSFSQRVEPRHEADMIRITERLIDLAGNLGGTFYLPYRLHARPDQLARLYPNAATFAARKRHYDPGLLFRNTMWDQYFA